MSVDFYAAVPAAEWPTLAAVQQCVAQHQYPIQLKRFPAFNAHHVVSDGALATVDGKQDTYLEGELFSIGNSAGDVQTINDRIAASSDPFRIAKGDVVMSIRTRSPAEMRAASYLISSLIVCFHGYGFEPQGDTHGRDDFAKSLISGADALKGL